MSGNLITSALHNYAAALVQPSFGGHDRLDTVGASEIGQCLRKTWFTKNETPPDASYQDRYGARLRGNLIEENYWVPALRAAYGSRLLWAGEEQKTLVDGYLSATPDGLLTGLERDCLAGSPFNIEDIGPSTCVVVEAKSIDPRANLRGGERPAHSFQTQAQMGLIRHATAYRPEVALISYVDASFLDDVTEFAVKWEPSIYEAAKSRAAKIMTSTTALDLPPEGKLSGGSECAYCPWSSACAHVTVAGVPATAAASLGDNAVAELHALRNAAVAAKEFADDSATALAGANEDIKEFLRTHQVRGHKEGGAEPWSVAWSTVKGREGIDLAALSAAVHDAGLDLAPFKKSGDPYDRLQVK